MIELDGARLELFYIKNFVAILFQLVEEVLKLKNEMGTHYLAVTITSLQYAISTVMGNWGHIISKLYICYNYIFAFLKNTFSHLLNYQSVL